MKNIFVLLAIAAVASLTPSAFATTGNDYIGVAPDVSVETISQAWFYGDYDGVHDNNDWLGHVLSTAGGDNGAATTDIGYQIGAVVWTNQTMHGRAEVWGTSGTIHSCDDWMSGCPTLQSDVDDNDYVYSTMYWNGANTQVTFYWDSEPNVGSTYSVWGTYSPGGGDSSTEFLLGRDTGPTYDEWHLQVGLESDDPASSISLDQYDIGWVENAGGVTYGKDKAFRSLERSGASTHWPTLVYVNPGYMFIGSNSYNDASGDYIKKSGSSVADGRIEWSSDASDDMAAAVLVWD